MRLSLFEISIFHCSKFQFFIVRNFSFEKKIWTYESRPVAPGPLRPRGLGPPSNLVFAKKRQSSPLDKFSWPPPELKRGPLTFFDRTLLFGESPGATGRDNPMQNRGLLHIWALSSYTFKPQYIEKLAEIFTNVFWHSLIRTMLSTTVYFRRTSFNTGCFRFSCRVHGDDDSRLIFLVASCLCYWYFAISLLSSMKVHGSSFLISAVRACVHPWPIRFIPGRSGSSLADLVDHF